MCAISDHIAHDDLHHLMSIVYCRLGIVTSGDTYLIACDYVYLVVVEGESHKEAGPPTKQRRPMSSEFRVETGVLFVTGAVVVVVASCDCLLCRIAIAEPTPLVLSII